MIAFFHSLCPFSTWYIPPYHCSCYKYIALWQYGTRVKLSSTTKFYILNHTSHTWSHVIACQLLNLVCASHIDKGLEQACNDHTQSNLWLGLLLLLLSNWVTPWHRSQKMCFNIFWKLLLSVELNCHSEITKANIKLSLKIIFANFLHCITKVCFMQHQIRFNEITFRMRKGYVTVQKC